MRKAILVGRHNAVDLPFEIAEQRNIEWSIDRAMCVQQFKQLCEDALVKGWVIVLQNIPGILAAAMSDVYTSVPIGVMISVPGPRVAGVTKTFVTEFIPDALVVIDAVKFANGRAVVEHDDVTAVRVTVDPVAPYVFSHIEWLNDE
jgi:hypothetical protein